MKSTHNWEIKEATILRNGEPGYFIECSGCGHRLTIPENASQFQIDMAVIMHFCMLTIDNISKEECDARTVYTPDSKHFQEKGYHGVLAENCEEARNYYILEVMEV